MTNMVDREQQDSDWAGRTIVGVPFESPHALTSLVLDQPDSSDVSDLASSRKLFKIRLADTAGRRSSASMLINKMYTWRGYGGAKLPAANHPHRITLVASDEGETLGTLTLGLDSRIGLLVDEIYKEEVDAVRQQGRIVCELTKLAVDQRKGSKRVLAALFHIAYVYGRLLHGVTDVFIEVNPRHLAFYERMLGFRQIGEQRLCARVNAPAILLRLELSYVDEQINRFGGNAQLGFSERSLYPYFFSKREEAGITRRVVELG
jgi:hypothetical protein